MANGVVKKLFCHFQIVFESFPVLFLVLGRIGNRLLRYFKDCWTECQPITPQLYDDFDEFPTRENPLKRRVNDSSSTTIVTRDKNNNTRPKKNYRQLAGLSDDEDFDQEPEYVPVPSSKRVKIKRFFLKF